MWLNKKKTPHIDMTLPGRNCFRDFVLLVIATRTLTAADNRGTSQEAIFCLLAQGDEHQTSRNQRRDKKLSCADCNGKWLTAHDFLITCLTACTYRKMTGTDVCSDSHTIRFWLHENEKLIESEIWRKDCFSSQTGCVCVFDMKAWMTPLHGTSLTRINMTLNCSLSRNGTAFFFQNEPKISWL